MKKELLPAKLYPEEPIWDRMYRRDIVPLIRLSAKITKMYLELRTKYLLSKNRH